MISLSQQERERFAAWCEQEASSDEALIAQMEKLNLPDAVKKKNRAEAVACRVVASILRSGESMTVRG